MGAEFHATELRKKLGLTVPPFLPQTAFKYLDVVYQELSLDGCLGMTLRVEGNVCVMVSSNIPEDGKKLFTAAHELGHVVIPSHAKSNSFKCTNNDIWGSSKNPQEVEANQFAAEWLMPREVFKPRCSKLEPNFESISMLGYEFNVSLTAAALRFVDVTDHEVVLVASENGMMKYFRASQDFPYRLDWGKVPNTYARNNLGGKPFPTEFMTVASDEWFKGTQPESEEILEYSVKLGDYNTVLTMLWVE
jgi:Zn-dependent peptidase ImmA (M78 family)